MHVPKPPHYFMKTFATFFLASALSIGAISCANARTTDGECHYAPVSSLSRFESKAFVSVNHPDRLQVVVIKKECNPVKVKVYDSYKSLVLETEIEANEAKLPVNIESLPAGTYTVELSRGNQTETSTFVRQ